MPMSYHYILVAGCARFMTSMKDFDRWFPGTYMQRIKEVRVEIVVEGKPVNASAFLMTVSPFFGSLILALSHRWIMWTSMLKRMRVSPSSVLNAFSGTVMWTQWPFPTLIHTCMRNACEIFRIENGTSLRILDLKVRVYRAFA